MTNITRGLAFRFLRISDEDVVWLRSILEAYDGLACLSGNSHGIVTLVTPLDRAVELDSLIDEIALEINIAKIKDPPNRVSIHYETFSEEAL